ncbi:MAG: gamma-glutamyl-phosphate reductase, partial [Ruminococcaceae bacterium]|nr:gamma-glutamyl-phosphate reductase [Oscillospiraceae bacterium]
MTTTEILQKAKASAPSLAMLDSDKKNKALLAMAKAIEDSSDKILA